MVSKRTVPLNTPAQKQCLQCGANYQRDNRNTYAYFERSKFCSSGCAGAHRTATAEANRAEMDKVFDKWVDKSGDCWLWIGARDKDGYGCFSYAGKQYKAHRVALALAGRPPQEGQYACHKCGNPPCVNPDHLYPGSPKENSRDTVVSGKHNHGQKHHSARLTEQDVIAIRAMNETHESIAAEFSVSRAAVTMIKTGKTWKHLL